MSVDNSMTLCGPVCLSWQYRDHLRWWHNRVVRSHSKDELDIMCWSRITTEMHWEQGASIHRCLRVPAAVIIWTGLNRFQFACPIFITWGSLVHILSPLTQFMKTTVEIWLDNGIWEFWALNIWLRSIVQSTNNAVTAVTDSITSFQSINDNAQDVTITCWQWATNKESVLADDQYVMWQY